VRGTSISEASSAFRLPAPTLNGPGHHAGGAAM